MYDYLALFNLDLRCIGESEIFVSFMYIRVGCARARRARPPKQLAMCADESTSRGPSHTQHEYRIWL